MSRGLAHVFLVIIFIGVAHGLSHAQNVTLNYQGQLGNAAGQPINDQFEMVFRLYGEAEAGVVLWSETHPAVNVVDGAFSVELGTIEVLEPELAQSVNLYLGVQVDGSPEMTPRMRVGTVLRAQWNAQAGDLNGLNIDPNSISVNGTPVVDEQGQWVGDPTGLWASWPPRATGLAGDVGPQGPVGPAGVAGPLSHRSPRRG